MIRSPVTDAVRAGAYKIVEEELRAMKGAGRVKLSLVTYDDSLSPDTLWTSWDRDTVSLLECVEMAAELP